MGIWAEALLRLPKRAIALSGVSWRSFEVFAPPRPLVVTLGHSLGEPKARRWSQGGD